ncbi:MAG: Coenzyme F420 hydrogenase/dehydrogenase, beta subunit C-terminal domain [Clostridia bacterium]
MLQTSNKKCTGCAVCSYICPQKCIEMKVDDEHFVAPIVNGEKCTNCNLCNKICPINNKKIEHMEKKCYVGQLKDENKLKKCASGGAFLGIAEYIIESNGKVFGVSYNNNKLYYEMIDTKKDLHKILNSKYFQCELSSDNYKQIVKCSRDGMILVSGTPCQISAIKNIPRLNIENVIFVEILCQGIPNKYVIDKFDSEKEKLKNKKIVNHIFRSKDKYVGKNYLNKYEYDDGSVEYYIGEDDPLSLTFQRQIFLRESCYKCQYANENRVADFTIGDYWDNDLKNSNIKLENGISVILCNTEKANKILLNQSELYLEQIDYKKAMKTNVPFHNAVKRPFERNFSYKLLKKGILPSTVAKITCFKYYLKKIIRREK